MSLFPKEVEYPFKERQNGIYCLNFAINLTEQATLQMKQSHLSVSSSPQCFSLCVKMDVCGHWSNKFDSCLMAPMEIIFIPEPHQLSLNLF